MLNHAACIMTYRQGPGQERRDNLLAVLRWLAQWPDLQVVVVEQDTQRRLTEALPHPKLSYHFVSNSGPFNKSWGLNVGARNSNADWLLFHDSDIILGEGLVHALNARREGFHAISPFSRMLDLDPDESAQLRDHDFNWLPYRPDPDASDREHQGEFMPLAGASILLSRTAFQTVGGWDERFVGWGGEDDAMSYLLNRAQVPSVSLNLRPAAHLHHQRSTETTTGQAHYQANLHLLNTYKSLGDAELLRSVAVRNGLNGNPKKYELRR